MVQHLGAVGGARQVHPRPVDRLLQVIPAVRERGDDLRESGRDAVSAGAADGQHRAVGAARHAGRHVRGQPLAGSEGVQAAAVELVLPQAVVEPHAGAGDRHARAVAGRRGHRAGEALDVDDADVRRRRRHPEPLLPAGDDAVQQGLARRGAIGGDVELGGAVPEHRPLHGDPALEVVVRPLVRGAAVEEQEHRGEDGTADRRRRVGRDQPVPDLDAGRAAHHRLEGVEVGPRDQPAVRGHVVGQRLRDVAGEERGRTLARDLLEEAREVRDDDVLADAPDGAVRALDGGQGLGVLRQQVLAQRAQVVVRGRAEREPAAADLERGLDEHVPRHVAVAAVRLLEGREQTGGADRPVADRHARAAGVLGAVDVARAPAERGRRQAASRHLDVAVDGDGGLAGRGDGHEGAAADRDDARFGHQRDQHGGERRVDGAAPSEPTRAPASADIRFGAATTTRAAPPPAEGRCTSVILAGVGGAARRGGGSVAAACRAGQRLSPWSRRSMDSCRARRASVSSMMCLASCGASCWERAPGRCWIPGTRDALGGVLGADGREHERDRQMAGRAGRGRRTRDPRGRAPTGQAPPRRLRITARHMVHPG